MVRQLRQQALLCSAGLASVLVGLAGVAMLRNAAVAQDRMVEAPIFEVDPLWPKPLPNGWLLGMTIGISIDAQDNVWIVHRGSSTLNNNEKGAELNPPISICCRSAPPVVALNPDGDVIPVPVFVPLGAAPNVEQRGTVYPGVLPHDIEWEYREDPDESDSDLVELAASKIVVPSPVKRSRVATITKPQDAKCLRKSSAAFETPPVPLPQVMIGCGTPTARSVG